MKTQNLRLSTFLGLLIYLFVPTHAVAKPLKGTVIFTRGGIVIELEERLKRTNQPDRSHPLPSLVIHEASESAGRNLPLLGSATNAPSQRMIGNLKRITTSRSHGLTAVYLR